MYSTITFHFFHTYVLQFVTGIWCFLYPGAADKCKTALLPYHVFFGVFTFALAVATAALGTSEKLISDLYANALNIFIIHFVHIALIDVHPFDINKEVRCWPNILRRFVISFSQVRRIQEVPGGRTVRKLFGLAVRRLRRISRVHGHQTGVQEMSRHGIRTPDFLTWLSAWWSSNTCKIISQKTARDAFGIRDFVFSAYLTILI